MSDRPHSAVLSPGRVQPYLGTDWQSGGPMLNMQTDESSLVHVADNNVHYRPCVGEEFSAHIHGSVAYAGPMVHHFGHFVAESIHRIVPSRRYFGAERFLFTTRKGNPTAYDSVPASLRPILEYLEIDETNFLMVNENTLVDSLLVVKQGSSIGMEADPAYLNLLREYSNQRLDDLHSGTATPKWVYVCGRRGPYGIVLGAAYVEAFLERAGFTLFRPEEHPYSLQLHVFRSAERLIFAEGSAIHGASLLGREMMQDVQVIVRRPDTPYIVQRFRAELVGRCRQSELVFCCRYLGSLIRQNGHQVNHLGISTYNLSAVRQIFYRYRLEQFANFDPKAYFEACERELLEYVKFATSLADNDCTPADLSTFFARFELTRRADCA